MEKYNKATTPEEKAKIECDPLKIFHQAVENCKPILKTTKIIKGGVTYQASTQSPKRGGGQSSSLTLSRV